MTFGESKNAHTHACTDDDTTSSYLKMISNLYLRTGLREKGGKIKRRIEDFQESETIL